MSEVAKNNHDHAARRIIRSYLIGFTLAVILTLALFYVVYRHALSGTQVYVFLAVLTTLLIFIEVIFFLRFNTKAEDRSWNWLAFFFTLIVVGIIFSGSLWIMYNLNYNMVH